MITAVMGGTRWGARSDASPTAPAGAWILYRPGENRRIVRVRYVDETRAGIVIWIRLFEAATGELLSEEDPDKPGRGRGRRKGKGN